MQGLVSLNLVRRAMKHAVQAQLEHNADQLQYLFSVHEQRYASGTPMPDGGRLLSKFYPFIKTIRFYSSDGKLLSSIGEAVTEEDLIQAGKEGFSMPRRAVERKNGKVFYFEIFPRLSRMRAEMPTLMWINAYFRHSLYIILISLPLALVFALYYANRVSRDTRNLAESLIRLSEGTGHVEFQAVRTIEHRKIADVGMSLQKQLKEKENRQIRRIQELTHDLKSPLAGLYTQLESVELGALELSEERFRHIYNELGYLNNLIDSMAEVYRLEDDHVSFSPEEIRVTLLFNLLLDRYRPLAADRGKEIRSRLQLVTIRADFDLILRAFGNLISNAVLHGSGRIILISLTETEGNTVFEVINDGHIPEEDLPHILTRYWSKNRNGSGLGLSISDLIARKHGGSLSVRNLEDHKVSFSLSFPQL